MIALDLLDPHRQAIMRRDLLSGMGHFLATEPYEPVEQYVLTTLLGVNVIINDQASAALKQVAKDIDAIQRRHYQTRSNHP